MVTLQASRNRISGVQLYARVKSVCLNVLSLMFVAIPSLTASELQFLHLQTSVTAIPSHVCNYNLRRLVHMSTFANTALPRLVNCFACSNGCCTRGLRKHICSTVCLPYAVCVRWATTPIPCETRTSLYLPVSTPPHLMWGEDLPPPYRNHRTSCVVVPFVDCVVTRCGNPGSSLV